MFKRFCLETLKVVACLVIISALSFGIYTFARENFKIGQASRNKLISQQTLAIVDLNASNEDLLNQVVVLSGENSELKIIVQTHKDEITNLKSTVKSLNATITTLQDEKTATDEVVKNLTSNVEYLNSYIEELENKLETYEKTRVVISLPDNFKDVKELVTYKLNEDEIFVCSKTDVKEAYGIYKYTVSTKNFEKVYDLSSYVKLIYNYCDRIIFYVYNYGCYYFSNNDFEKLNVNIEDRPTINGYLYELDDTHDILIGHNYVYYVDKVNFTLKAFNKSIDYSSFESYNSKYVCVYSSYRGCCMFDIENLSCVYSNSVAGLSKCYEFSDKYGAVHDNKHLYVFDMERGEVDIEEVSNLSSVVTFVDNYIIFRDFNTYQLYIYNGNTKELNTVSNCPTSSYVVHKNDEYLFLTYSRNTNIYTINFETNSLEVFNDTYGGDVKILFTNDSFIVSGNKKLAYYDKSNQTFVEKTQYVAYGKDTLTNINYKYEDYLSLGDGYSILYSSSSSSVPLLIKNDLTVVEAICTGSISTSSVGVNILYDFEDVIVFNVYNYIFIYNKQSHKVCSASEYNIKVEYVEDQNGYHIFKRINTDDTIVYMRYDPELNKFVSYEYQF